MCEVVFENKLIVIRVILLVGFLNCVSSLLQLLSEFIHQRICGVHRLRILETPCLVETLKKLKV